MHDRDNNLAIDSDGLLCQSRDPKAWNGTRCTRGVVGKGFACIIFCFFLIRFLTRSAHMYHFVHSGVHAQNSINIIGRKF